MISTAKVFYEKTLSPDTRPQNKTLSPNGQTNSLSDCQTVTCLMDGECLKKKTRTEGTTQLLRQTYLHIKV